ncbi:PREDICTED: uncharacterized protein LOC106330633 [Brassica oleracea var. oleracea]|uniref:uncharacterized protein LOC106330633 n=1 Tax=Brassica oleracea var. oleracea TaxID=109376 RepID=UPI0006A754C8|nr:PREDICTED: uncharacterized protein LOC106330633 [Brassica oleracea var. oleracea]
MKLNPAKCRFAVASGKFLGYLVTYRGIETNPKQIDALIEMASPKNRREVQRLTRRVAALNLFISRSTDKCLPFYDILRGNKKFVWSEECENAFQQLKRVQNPKYLHSPSQSGRLAKWAVELSEYDIEYRQKMSAKSQVLAEFLVELPTGIVTNKEPNSTWVLYVDRSSSKQGSGIGIHLTSPNSEILEQSFRLEFHVSNNEAEYETLIVGLRLAHGLTIRNIHAYCDSQLVTSQYSRE